MEGERVVSRRQLIEGVVAVDVGEGGGAERDVCRVAERLVVVEVVLER